MKLKNFFTAIKTTNRIKRQFTGVEIFTNHTLTKGLISRIYKKLSLLNKKKTDNPIQKQANDLNSYFSKNEIEMAN